MRSATRRCWWCATWTDLRSHQVHEHGFDDARVHVLRIDGTDRAALDAIPGGSTVRFLKVIRLAGGERRFQTDPYLTRPRDLRQRVVHLLQKAASSRWIDQLAAEAEPDSQEELESSGVSATPADACRALADRLEKADESFTEELLTAIDSLHGLLRGGNARTDRATLASALAVLASQERTEHPHQAAINTLSRRLPPIARFSDDARELLPDYDLSDTSNWNQAVRNLVALAGTSMEELASVTNDAAKMKNVLDPANARLAEFFAEYWTQAPITVALALVQERLEVLTERWPNQWSSIGESSDGMRAFVALLAYSRQFSSELHPIFLIDEAERHLHYDAQADLVRVFETQTAAEQIVYTTHSLGCLPQDLGKGLRAIDPIAATDESRVINSVWDLGKGMEPVARAIGASALAFVAARYAVFAEGGTEATLLPTLMREANHLDHLQYQILPGLSEASREVIGRVSLDAVHLVYLIDGDQSGREKDAYLVRRGIAKDRVKVLGGRWSGATTEDVVFRAKYVAAVSAEIKDRHGFDFDAGIRMPDVGRARFVDHWCRRRGFELSHTAIAARLLEAEAPLVQTNRGRWLRDLHSDLEKTLRIGETEGQERVS